MLLRSRRILSPSRAASLLSTRSPLKLPRPSLSSLAGLSAPLPATILPTIPRTRETPTTIMVSTLGSNRAPRDRTHSLDSDPLAPTTRLSNPII